MVKPPGHESTTGLRTHRAQEQGWLCAFTPSQHLFPMPRFPGWGGRSRSLPPLDRSRDCERAGKVSRGLDPGAGLLSWLSWAFPMKPEDKGEAW